MAKKHTPMQPTAPPGIAFTPSATASIFLPATVMPLFSTSIQQPATPARRHRATTRCSAALFVISPDAVAWFVATRTRLFSADQYFSVPLFSSLAVLRNASGDPA